MEKFDFSVFPKLETERLLLKEITVDDAEALFSMRTNSEVMRYIDRPIPESINEVIDLIDKMKVMKENGEGISWGIFLKENPNLQIGNIGFFRSMPEHFRAEIGYMLTPSEHRKGIMFEAMQKVLEYGFNEMKLHSVEAHINALNDASANILLKAGFVREAYFKENYFFNNKFIDTAVYSIINNK